MWNLNVQGKKQDIAQLLDDAKTVEHKAAELEADPSLAAVYLDSDHNHDAQVTAAKAVAHQLIDTVGGDKVVISLAGHSNGPKGPGHALVSNDFITVSVSRGF